MKILEKIDSIEAEKLKKGKNRLFQRPDSSLNEKSFGVRPESTFNKFLRVQSEKKKQFNFAKKKKRNPAGKNGIEKRILGFARKKVACVLCLLNDVMK